MNKNDITVYMNNVSASVVSQNNVFAFAKYTREELSKYVQLVEENKGKAGAYAPAKRRLENMIIDAYKSIGIMDVDRNIRGLDLEELKVLANNPALPAKYDSNELIARLDKEYSQYPNRKAYARRIAERLCDSEFKNENGELTDSVRATVLKQFVKYGIGSASIIKKAMESYPKDKKAPSKSAKRDYALRRINDEFIDACLSDYEMLENQRSEKRIKENNAKSEYSKKSAQYKAAEKEYNDSLEQIKAFKDKFEIVFFADEFANGIVRRSYKKQITKEALYKFAIAFNMTYYDEDETGGEAYDSTLDIRKNLFEDYYTANLFDNQDRDFEENLGDGIDYKSFAEVIYLYYIRQRRQPDATDDDRVARAEAMIKACFKRIKEECVKSHKKSVDYIDTNYMKDIPFDYSEKEFEEYIVNNYYDFFSDEINPSASSIWRAPRQITAKREYSKIVADLQNKNIRSLLRSDMFDKCSLDLIKLVSLVYDDILDSYEDIVSGQVSDNTFISRERLIAIYCLAYLEEYKRKKRHLEADRIFDDFCFALSKQSEYDSIRGLNNILDDCRYQQFTVKNLFDVIILSIVYINVF